MLDHLDLGGGIRRRSAQEVFDLGANGRGVGRKVPVRNRGFPAADVLPFDEGDPRLTNDAILRVLDRRVARLLLLDAKLDLLTGSSLEPL